MAWSLLNHMLADDVRKLLDRPEFHHEPEGERFFEREKAEAIIHAAVWGYSSRIGDDAGCCAFSNLMDVLGLKNWTFDEDEAAALSAFRLKRMREKVSIPSPPPPPAKNA